MDMYGLHSTEEQADERRQERNEYDNGTTSIAQNGGAQAHGTDVLDQERMDDQGSTPAPVHTGTYLIDAIREQLDIVCFRPGGLELFASGAVVDRSSLLHALGPSVSLGAAHAAIKERISELRALMNYVQGLHGASEGRADVQQKYNRVTRMRKDLAKQKTFLVDVSKTLKGAISKCRKASTSKAGAKWQRLVNGLKASAESAKCDMMEYSNSDHEIVYNLFGKNFITDVSISKPSGVCTASFRELHGSEEIMDAVLDADLKILIETSQFDKLGTELSRVVTIESLEDRFAGSDGDDGTAEESAKQTPASFPVRFALRALIEDILIMCDAEEAMLLGKKSNSTCERLFFGHGLVRKVLYGLRLQYFGSALAHLELLPGGQKREHRQDILLPTKYEPYELVVTVQQSTHQGNILLRGSCLPARDAEPPTASVDETKLQLPLDFQFGISSCASAADNEKGEVALEYVLLLEPRIAVTLGIAQKLEGFGPGTAPHALNDTLKNPSVLAERSHVTLLDLLTESPPRTEDEKHQSSLNTYSATIARPQATERFRFFQLRDSLCPGVLVSRVPFSHPAQLAPILRLLRQQLLFNELYLSCSLLRIGDELSKVPWVGTDGEFCSRIGDCSMDKVLSVEICVFQAPEVLEATLQSVRSGEEHVISLSVYVGLNGMLTAKSRTHKLVREHRAPCGFLETSVDVESGVSDETVTTLLVSCRSIPLVLHHILVNAR
ncbi:hypothetical protein FVE85_8419 [Porphyridium purpureum]|uniref:Mediator of RNA polymerase II transcription subunit 1 n=1 Tax=Porphyridium purpureum TaxID=35688 RepID=A0A5J4YNG1_PORPP|nr:hypothetical protein FVE85_8419 [Porphyridium purpureum]|eukprot:POR6183..scf244_11